MKKTAFLLLAFLFAINMQAQIALVGHTPLGTTFERAKKSLQTDFGTAHEYHKDRIVYDSVAFHNIDYSRAEFLFKSGKFTEARFTRMSANKKAAQDEMEMIAREMSKTFRLSKDIEDAGRWFYKGGKAPTSVGYLFTIFTYPQKGHYVTELRYGPIKFRDEN